jgi:DNA-binding NtrC family response regulator
VEGGRGKEVPEGPAGGAKRPSLPLPAELARTVRKAARIDATVLLFGETGTGKSTLAHWIHAGSGRSKSRFVRVDCASLTSDLAASELWGHVQGAFTGATRAREGLVRRAEGGTLFFDEVSVLSWSNQTRLLSILEEHVVRPLGSDREFRVDVRIIGASNEDLEALVRTHRFRADLFYRLNVLPVRVPPLRERQAELREIVDYLLGDILRKELKAQGKGVPEVTVPAVELLERQPWRGNLRELRNALIFALSHGDGGPLLPKHLPDRIRRGRPVAQPEDRSPPHATPEQKHLGNPSGKPALGPRAKRRYRAPADPAKERAAVLLALQKTGSVRGAAVRLGASRDTIYDRIRKHRIRDEEWKDPVGM